MKAHSVLLLALFCIPFHAEAQMPAPTGQSPATRFLAEQLMQKCEDTDEMGQFDPISCFEQHVDDGAQAAKRRDWSKAITEENDAIALLLTYPQKLKFLVNAGAVVFANGNVAQNGIIAPYIIESDVYEENKQYDLAISDATAAIALDPAEPFLWNDRCWNRAISGDLADALQDCNKALQLTPDDPNILDSAGFVYLRLKQYPAAISNYQAALKINPKIASSLYGLGLAEQALNEQAQGKLDIAAAEHIDPNIASDFGT